MQSDFIFQPQAFDDISLIFFLVTGGIMVASALGTVLSKNPLNSVLCLVTNLLGVAGLYASLHAHFLASVQIIVYAGAIVVLFLFVVMLLNVKVEYERTGGILARVLALCLALAFVCMVIFSFAPVLNEWIEPETVLQGTVKGVGRLLYSEYVFLFELVSLVLVSAMAGAVMLARKRKRGLGPDFEKLKE